MNRFGWILSLTFASFSVLASAQSREVKLKPLPQEMKMAAGKAITVRNFELVNESDFDLDVLRELKESLPTSQGGRSVQVVLKPLKSGDARLKRSGAYRLNVGADRITIEAADARAQKYAVQALKQLAVSEDEGWFSVPHIVLTDYPDVEFRGVVEGFYGEPWTHADRLDQIRFYGDNKLNTYIYAPKDDPYHSSPHWRDRYPQDEANNIRELAAEAAKNKVDFVWAIHPGKDIDWSTNDYNAIVSKFEAMYDLGVRSFAIFFDDISGVGADPEKQADLLNYVHKQFVTKKEGVTPLIMCPTEYNKSWANKEPNSYLDILGKKLNKSIRIMWTGDKVVDDITVEGLEWVNNRIKRNAYVWWNFPVCDYVRDHLLMGPAYGIDPQADKVMSGFVSNPMDKPEASKVALYGVSQYAWNMSKYDPKSSWREACAVLMPGAPYAFELFCEHNSDPGNNGHEYRREESEKIAPVIRQFMEGYAKGEFKTQQALEIIALFNQIKAAPAEIRSNGGNAAMIEEIDPWLTQFELLGQTGYQVMQLAKYWQFKKTESAWDLYLKTDSLLKEMNNIDNTLNQNPYQPGVKVGSKVLYPFINQLFDYISGSMIAHTAGVEAQSGAIGGNVRYTNIVQLGAQPLINDKNTIAYSPAMEMVRIAPNDFIGFALGKDKVGQKLLFNFKIDGISNWGQFESSTDGETWTRLTVMDENGRGMIDNLLPNTRFIRFINKSKYAEAVFLSEFKIFTEVGENTEAVEAINDNDLKSYLLLEPGKTITVQKPKDSKPVATVLTLFVETVPDNNLNIRATKSKVNSGGYEGWKNFVELSTKGLDNPDFITIKCAGKQPIKLYEIVWK